MDKPKLNFAVVAELINLSKKHGSLAASQDRWDFLVGQKLMWFDRLSHICKTPPERFTDDFRLQTICGLDVTTPKLCVVEDGEFSDPSCPDCFRKALEPQGIPARDGVLRSTSIGCALAALVIALNMGLFAEDTPAPREPIATTHQLTYVPDDPPEPPSFDDL
ncbi:MAG: hypothetical protein K0Q70_392 [Rhodospirillales bacterium]|jgi:hypothetical protein|nr:hypothetical protein [Rhodospirillales bacterium]